MCTVLDQLANNYLVDIQGAHNIVKYWYVLCDNCAHSWVHKTGNAVFKQIIFLYVLTEIGDCLGQIVFPSGAIPQSTAFEITLTRNKKYSWITSTKSPGFRSVSLGSHHGSQECKVMCFCLLLLILSCTICTYLDWWWDLCLKFWCKMTGTIWK